MSDLIHETDFEPADEVYSVSSLLRETRSLLELEFGSVIVEGEISNLARPASGHLYFTLKDDKSQVRCALFRGQRVGVVAEPENGMLVRVRARVSLYEPRGDFQLIVSRLEPAGAGALQQAFEKLKLKLLNEGLFEPEYKQALPRFPKRIGVVTSPSGAVIHDILTTLRRRFPAIAVTLLPVPVQGAEAAPKIVEALQIAQQYGECDALIVARGGGSLEDLWAFNEEVVARALFDCTIPVVSSIGHETDFTIADFVADVRAPTPTAAAEMLSPNAGDLLKLLDNTESRLTRLVGDKIATCAQAVDLTAKRLLHPGRKIDLVARQMEQLNRRAEKAMQRQLVTASLRLQPLAKQLLNASPADRINQLQAGFRNLANRFTLANRNSLQARRTALTTLTQRLNTLNPLETLGRGYAIFYQEDGKHIIDRAAKAMPGTHAQVQVADGRIRCLIEDVYETE